MNASTRLSAKGQIVIPKDVRDQHGWSQGMLFEVVDRADGILLKPATASSRKISLEMFRKRVPPHAGKPVTIEEMDQAVLDIATERHRRAVD